MEPLVRIVLGAVRRVGLGPSSHVGVACSGGGDSTALGHATAALVGLGALGRVTLVHVDHGLRTDSARDADHVAALAAAIGAGFHAASAAVDRERASLEAAAREARYAALERAAEALALDAMLLAHTADDQAETVLLRIVRGTGIAGLAAMAERRDGYLRPLLATRRGTLARYRRQHGIAALEDPMNDERRFARVRMRHDLMPALAGENPRLVDALGRLAAQAGEAAAALAWAADALLVRADHRDGALLVAAFARTPSAIAKRALAAAATAAGLGALEAVHLEALLALIGRAGGHLDLPGGTADLEHGVLRIAAAAVGQLPAIAPALAIDGPGGPFEVRRHLPGDRMRPVRLRGRSRKLSRLYNDLRIPRTARALARVVVDPTGAIVWAEHIGGAWESSARVSLTGVDPVASNKN